MKMPWEEYCDRYATALCLLVEDLPRPQAIAAAHAARGDYDASGNPTPESDAADEVECWDEDGEEPNAAA